MEYETKTLYFCKSDKYEGSKALYRTEKSTELYTVENIVKLYLEENGFSVFNYEGRTILIAVTLGTNWRLNEQNINIFEDIASTAGCVNFSDRLVDLTRKHFSGKTLEEVIYKFRIADRDTVRSKCEIVNSALGLEFNYEYIYNFVKCIGKDGLNKLYSEYIKHIFGWPDLIAFKDDKVFFIEVKGAGDNLTEFQASFIKKVVPKLDINFHVVNVYSGDPNNNSITFLEEKDVCISLEKTIDIGHNFKKLKNDEPFTEKKELIDKAFLKKITDNGFYATTFTTLDPIKLLVFLASFRELITEDEYTLKPYLHVLYHSANCKTDELDLQNGYPHLKILNREIILDNIKKTNLNLILSNFDYIKKLGYFNDYKKPISKKTISYLWKALKRDSIYKFSEEFFRDPLAYKKNPFSLLIIDKINNYVYLGQYSNNRRNFSNYQQKYQEKLLCKSGIGSCNFSLSFNSMWD